MEDLKALDDLGKPDERNLCWVRLDTGQPITLTDRYSAIAAVRLDPGVPQEVRSYFATIQNLCLYGWFSYDFYSVAVFLSYTLIEMALRARLPVPGVDKRSFRALLEQAVKRGLIRQKAFSRVREMRRQRAESLRMDRDLARLLGMPLRHGIPRSDYLKILCESLPYLRNSQAHPRGHAIHFPHDAVDAVGFASEFINQLYASPKPKETRSRG